MPVAPIYPGVYIEEIPSGVRTIPGVPTSITAFIGRALMGPVNVATAIRSYDDFERIFGGLWIDSSLGYAVHDFYLNGGRQAIVVRLYHAKTGDNPKASLSFGNVKLEAASEGEWGSWLRGSTDQTAVAAGNTGLRPSDLFNLTVFEDKPGGRTEIFRNVSFKESARRVDRVLAAESTLVRWKGQFKGDAMVSVAIDPVTKKTKDLADKQRALDDLPAGDPSISTATASRDLAAAALQIAVNKMSASDGDALTLADDFLPNDAAKDKKGLYALEQVDLFNILCLPPYNATSDVDQELVTAAALYCEQRRAMLIVDPPSSWETTEHARAGITADLGTSSKNAALYFPRLRQPNILRDNQLENFAPCGAVAGVYARTDEQRGVWKAPAGLDAALSNVPALSVNLTDAENGELNPLGVNCLRSFDSRGRVVWGARTMQGADRFGSEWKYVPVRRTALFIEESLSRGTAWAVFEPNDEPLWAQLRLNVGAFMHNLFRQGAFQGTSPKDAYFVECDKETTTQDDVNLGVVNIMVGFAPLKPAEFVILRIQQMAGQIDT